MASGGEIRINASVVGGALLLVLAAVAFWGACGGTPAVWLFPRLAAVVLAVCGALLVEEGLRKPDRVVLWESWREARDVLTFALGAALYAVALVWLGFWMATALMVAGAAQGLQAGRPGRLPIWLVTGVVVGLGFDALFVGVFRVPLPGGALWGDAPWRPWLP